MTDCTDTAPDLLQVILDEVISQRGMLQRVEEEMRATKADVGGLIEMLREFGLRLNLIERRHTPAPTPLPESHKGDDRA